MVFSPVLVILISPLGEKQTLVLHKLMSALGQKRTFQDRYQLKSARRPLPKSGLPHKLRKFRFILHELEDEAAR
jgi:hypothetical protein